MIGFATIEVGRGGLPSCRLCVPSVPMAPRSSADVVADVRRVAESWAAGPGPNIALVGGDAFAHPGLPSIVSQSVALGVERVRLQTSGAPLAAHGNALGALRAGVRHVDVVLLAGDSGNHDALCGTEQAFTAAVNGMAGWREASDEDRHPTVLTGTVPVCRHTLVHVPAAVAAFARAGAIAVHLAVSAHAAADPALSEWIGAGADTGVVNGIWVSVEGVRPGTVPSLHERSVYALLNST
ncbi:MAG: hypothetical protein HY876_08530 [Coriobacteriales bacterium]|nr:hypothetical protein [Coriobacteriales bacterium]